MSSLPSHLASWNLEKKRVILRTDFNVPINNDIIQSEFRLNATKPTLDLLKQKGAITTIITHLSTKNDRYPSTKIFENWFLKNGYPYEYAPTIDHAITLSTRLPAGSFIILENIRSFKQEKDGDTQFAQKLASLGSFFVQDAFGALHRNDTSIVQLPLLFDSMHKTVGLCVERELNVLNTIKESPSRPFVLIAGGSKIKDKLSRVCDLVPLVDTILLCPALSFTVAQMQGIDVGASLVDHDAFDQAKKLLQKTTKHTVPLYTPTDYQVARHKISNDLHNKAAHTLLPDDIGISLGNQTINQFQKIIRESGTVILSGAFGFLDHPKTLEGMHAIITTMAESSGVSVIAGGDSVTIAERFPESEKIDHLSTGGGATLAYLSDTPLPGLVALQAD